MWGNTCKTSSTHKRTVWICVQNCSYFPLLKHCIYLLSFFVWFMCIWYAFFNPFADDIDFLCFCHGSGWSKKKKMQILPTSGQCSTCSRVDSSLGARTFLGCSTCITFVLCVATRTPRYLCPSWSPTPTPWNGALQKYIRLNKTLVYWIKH